MLQLPDHMYQYPKGWRTVVTQLLQDIESLAKKRGFTCNVFQIKEKFGGLRFYYALQEASNESCNLVAELVAKAEKETAALCQECGKPGAGVVVNGWHVTLCEEHANGQ